MLRKLKSRRRADSIVSEPRRPRETRWDALVYLAILLAFFAVLANYAIGDRIFLRAHGLVLRDRIVLAPTSLVKITRIDVSPGDPVAPGQEVMRAESVEVLNRLADFSLRAAELDERVAALATRLTEAREAIPVLESRRADLLVESDRLSARRLRGPSTPERVAAVSRSTARVRPEDALSQDTLDRLEDLAQKTHLTDLRLTEARTRLAGIAAELSAAREARIDARDAVRDLSAYYEGGAIHSPVHGLVGDTVPAPGEVFRPGEPMATLLHGPTFVLAFLPPGHLFRIREGTRVRIVGATTTRIGTIDAVLPVSKSIPDEFRTAFRIDETRQMARIRLEEGTDLPVFSSVRVTRDHRLARWFTGAAKQAPRSMTADAP